MLCFLKVDASSPSGSGFHAYLHPPTTYISRGWELHIYGYTYIDVYIVTYMLKANSVPYNWLSDNTKLLVSFFLESCILVVLKSIPVFYIK